MTMTATNILSISSLSPRRKKYDQPMHPLKVARMHHNLTQQMLADFTMLSKSTIERAERGEPLSAYTRRQLCDYFGKSSQELGLIARPLFGA